MKKEQASVDTNIRECIQRRRDNQRKLEKNLLEYIENSIKTPSPEKISILPEMVHELVELWKSHTF